MAAQVAFPSFKLPELPPALPLASIPMAAQVAFPRFQVTSVTPSFAASKYPYGCPGGLSQLPSYQGCSQLRPQLFPSIPMAAHVAFPSLQVTRSTPIYGDTAQFLWLPRWPFPASELPEVSLLIVFLPSSYGCPGGLSQPPSYQMCRYFR